MSKYQESLSYIINKYLDMHYEGKPMNEDTEHALRLQELVNQADSFKWIPFVTKSNELASELPLQYEVILVTDGKKIWTDLWMGIGGCFGLGSGTQLVGLAWMSMPELYKEKEND